MNHIDLIPELFGLNGGEVSLSKDAKLYLFTQGVIESNGKFLKKNPLVVPDICEQFVKKVQDAVGYQYSFGGWMEDRYYLWKDSYLDTTGNYTHLGIDINTPENFSVVNPFSGKVVLSLDDTPLQYGWGNYYILESDLDSSHYLLIAHLSKKRLKNTGDTIKAGELIGYVGGHHDNGGWFKHIHVQAIKKDYIDSLLRSGIIDDLDGYAKCDTTQLRELYPDPFLVF